MIFRPVKPKSIGFHAELSRTSQFMSKMDVAGRILQGRDYPVASIEVTL